MRLAFVIVVMTVIAVALVRIRRRADRLGHEVQVLRMKQDVLRRRPWDQEVNVGYLTDEQRIRERVRRMPVGVVDADESAGCPVGMSTPRDSWRR